MSKAPLTWKSETRKLRELKPWGKNPRKIDEEQAEHLKASLEKFGEVYPILISPKNHIYDGHQREKVMGMMDNYNPDTEIDVRVSSRMLTTKERIELIVRLHENEGEWDPELVKELYDPAELEEWGASGMAELVEWEDDEPEPDPGAQVDKAEELREKWGVERGQLWQLGDHRVIVGDCTDAVVVERLMGGEKARQLVTSPPYLNLRDYELGDFDWNELANGFIRLTFDLVAGDPFDALINLGLVHRQGVLRYWESWLDYCEEIGHNLYGWYVWDKLKAMPGDAHGRLAPAHEFIFHFSIGRESANKTVKTAEDSKKRAQRKKSSDRPFRQRDGSLKEVTGGKHTLGQPYKIPDSVIREASANTGGQIEAAHPAVFSVGLATKLIEPWSKSGDVIYEPFLGSGTTLIASQRLDRKCYGIEIEPKYISLALERWHQMTGEMPELIGGMPVSVNDKEEAKT